MKVEVNTLNGCGTWELVEKITGQNIVPGKRVFKIKRGPKGEVEKYKARYVAKGFKQIEGIEYFETFAPTSKPETFRMLLAISAQENLKLRQLDVKSACLHPKIEEEVFLEQPPGFVKTGNKGKQLVCNLNKSIYGLKRAAKNWYQELAQFLEAQNFVRSKNDYCLFYKLTGEDKLYVLTWVDDIVIAASSEKVIENLRRSFESKFRMDDRGELSWFLGMKISNFKNCVTSTQKTFWQVLI